MLPQTPKTKGNTDASAGMEHRERCRPLKPRIITLVAVLVWKRKIGVDLEDLDQGS